MRSRGILIAIITAGLLAFLAVLTVPPRPAGSTGERNFRLPEKIYNYFAYVYFFTRAQWLAGMDELPAARRAAARAAWHRPEKIGQFTRVGPGDNLARGKRYAELGLWDQAGCFFRAAEPGSAGTEDRATEILSYLAMLGDWPGVRSRGEEILHHLPASSEVDYWLGRALVETGDFAAAIPFLDRADDRSPSAGDALYQKGRAYERTGARERALGLYRRAAEKSPGHRGAWQALSRIYAAQGDRTRLKLAADELDRLSPPFPENYRLENLFILLGHSFPRRQVSTADTVTVELYLQGWSWRPVTVRPEVVFTDGAGMEASRRLAELALPGPGEVIRESRQFELPDCLAPGPIAVRLVFLDPETDLPRGVINHAENSIPLGQLHLQPRWMPSPIGEGSVKRRFGRSARPVGRSAILAVGKSLKLPLPDAGEVAALGLISGVFSRPGGRGGLFQGQKIGTVLVETPGGERILLPIKLGVQTADIFWDRPAAAPPRHRKVNTFGENGLGWPETRPAGNHYLAVYEFSSPLTPKSVKIECTAPGLALQIADLILIPQAGEATAAAERSPD